MRPNALAVLVLSASAALPLGAAGAPPDDALARGRELFERAWRPDDPRSHTGDGLGPVFNAQSCLACHDQGGVGGAGGVDRNIEVATARPAGSFNTVSFGGPGYQFSYGFGMSFGGDGFQYQFASNVPGQPNQGGRRERAAPAPRLDPVALATAHPGLVDAPTVVLHRYGTDPDYHAWRAGVAGRHGAVEVRTAFLNPTPLFGLGRLDAIPDEVIEAGARRKPGRTTGRVGRLAGGRVGRFGWKAQVATLAEFVANAASSEIGLEVPGRPQAADPRLPGLAAKGLDLNAADLEALAAFVRAIPEPVALELADEGQADDVKAGLSAFKAVGCAGCHVPDLGEVAGVYSDLLLHEMSPALGDSGPYGVLLAQDAPARERSRTAPATANEWRTPPLWGLRDSAPYLHDGRAATVDEAVRLHGGQGATSAQRYARLSPRKRGQLKEFLMSLAAPSPENR